MKSRKLWLLSTTVTPLAAAAVLTVGMATPASADGSGCDYGQKSAALPEAKARGGNVILAMSHEKKPCAPNPCAAKTKAEETANPCAAKSKAEDMANPCAAKKKAGEMANPCAAKPCAPKSQ